MPEEYYEKPKEMPSNKSHKKLLLIPIVMIILIAASYYLYTQSAMAKYAQSVNDFKDISKNASESITKVTGGIGESFSIVNLIQHDSMEVFIRNTGMNDIDIGTLTASIDGVRKSIVGNSGILKSGYVAGFNITSDSSSCNKTLTLMLSSGISVREIIVC
jgi:hypothetical protein